MDARTSTLLEAIAFGDGDDVRPADRLRAAELLDAADDGYDHRAVDMARILDGMSEAELRADVDQMAAAHVLAAWKVPEEWPAISQALRQILGNVKDSRESPTPPDRGPAELDGGHAATELSRPDPDREPLKPVVPRFAARSRRFMWKRSSLGSRSRLAETWIRGRTLPTMDPIERHS